MAPLEALIHNDDDDDVEEEDMDLCWGMLEFPPPINTVKENGDTQVTCVWTRPGL